MQEENNLQPLQLQIAALRAAEPAADGAAILLKADALLAGERRSLAIAIMRDLAPLVAVTLLAKAAEAGTVPGEANAPPVPPALECLGIGAVAAQDPSRVRLHLQFDNGLMLPAEISKEAARALIRGLESELKS
ncbi:hypothetical protein [Methylibium petroleiphilum]|uniref:hypothetical protein n=1 Tax=Methylibium petroleiphilum TaxID=105560 RepID=UPI003D2AE85E